MKKWFLQIQHTYHKDILSEGNRPKPQQLHIKAFHAKRQPTQGWILKGMHEIDTCYREDIGDEDDESGFIIKAWLRHSHGENTFLMNEASIQCISIVPKTQLEYKIVPKLIGAHSS